MKKVQKGGATDFFDMKNVTDVWSNTIKPLGEEQFRLLPDSIIFGSAILAFLTQSFSMVIFFVSMIETAGIQAGLQSLFGYLDANRLIPSAAAATPQCRSGFMKSTLESLSFMAGSTIPSAYPSPPLFFLSHDKNPKRSLLVVDVMKCLSQKSDTGANRLRPRKKAL